MKYYVVIDTNVIISSILNIASVPGVIVTKALEGKIVPILNKEIVYEYKEVLLRKKFGFDKYLVEDFIENFKKRAIFMNRTKCLEPFIDPDDVVFYELVLSAKSLTDAFLVTGNIKHFPDKNFVVTPREMMDILEKE